MTYSIVARCPQSGAFGIAITSSSICVASRCAWVSPLGNLLASEVVPERMIAAYKDAKGQPFAERLMRALEAGLAAGGETGDEHGAGLHVANVYDWPVVDLRVDWHEEPIAELRRIWG